MESLYPPPPKESMQPWRQFMGKPWGCGNVRVATLTHYLGPTELAR
jgi:hypothetical protein